jgi:two-component system, NarL family, nitrate/nitrite response regulator NarL
VVLLDLLLADRSDPADNVRRVATAGPRVLVISVVADPSQITAAYAAGAAGYLTKDHDLAPLLRRRPDPRRAARRTGIRPATAKHYLERIKEKYRSAGRPTYTKLDLTTRVREDGLLRYAPTQRTRAC